ncbi:MAG: glycosyltransferase [Paludibacter sp.]|nr:glycosyltransferase [Paludibacter sp.]
MKFSLVIPVYNAESYVEKCIRSCETQDIPHSAYELIIINDGSTDNSLSVIEKLSKEFPNLVIHSQENAGLSSARNQGLSLAKGEYVWFIDSDDWIESNCLGEIYNQMNHYNLDVLICKFTDTDGIHFNIRFDSNLAITKMIDGKSHLLSFNYSFSVPMNICKRSFLLENNLYFMKGIFHEDNEFTLRMFYFAKRIMTCGKPFYYVYHSPKSITRSVNPQKAFDLLKVANSHLLFRDGDVPEPEIKVVFNNCIGLALNAALENIKYMSAKNRQLFYVELRKRKDFFYAMLKSDRTKYRLEAILYLFSPYIFQVMYGFWVCFKKQGTAKIL